MAIHQTQQILKHVAASKPGVNITIPRELHHNGRNQIVVLAYLPHHNAVKNSINSHAGGFIL